MTLRSYIWLIFILVPVVLSAGERTVANSSIQSYKPETKIVGGSTVAIEEVPFVVSVEYRGRHLCGGSIVSDLWIFTSARCIAERCKDFFTIRAGTATKNSNGVVHDIHDYVFHPNYDLEDYDFGLIKLKSALSFTEQIKSIGFAYQDEDLNNGDLLRVIGYGVTEERGAPQNDLKAVMVPYISPDQCHVRFKYAVTARMFCAGYVMGGRDACTGDGGSPAVIKNKVHGLVSFGHGCGRWLLPGVYARVAKVSEWIEKQIK